MCWELSINYYLSVREVSEDQTYDTIEFNEFLQLMSKEINRAVTPEDLIEAFKYIKSIFTSWKYLYSPEYLTNRTQGKLICQMWWSLWWRWESNWKGFRLYYSLNINFWDVVDMKWSSLLKWQTQEMRDQFTTEVGKLILLLTTFLNLLAHCFWY